MDTPLRIAVLIPCFNEEKTIAKVVADFRRELPDADIYVYDNNSSDRTVERAVAAGAIVRREPRQGKGFVVQRMLRDVDADVYVLVDGDDTYPAEVVGRMIGAIGDGADMVVGDRLSNGTYDKENKRSFHGFGNMLVRWLVNMLFKADLRDIMSGYRVFSRAFVKHYPVLVGGFQLETDMTIFALDRDFVIREVPVGYRDRPKGSVSKLNTYSDGARVLLVIFNLFRYYRPLPYFTWLAAVFLVAGLVAGVPVVVEFIGTAYVTKVPSAVLAVAFVLLSALSFMSGIILDAVRRSDAEAFERGMKRS